MNHGSILVVDDEEIILETLSSDLIKKGYDVSKAANGEEAIKQFKENEFDLIITDLIMEGINGIDVLKLAKEKYPNIMIIILTGYGSIETAIEAVRHGASDYVLKPYFKADMLMRVSNCFEKIELLKKVKIYEDILPVCCKCKMIRDDDGKEHGTGEWKEMSHYLMSKSKIKVSHTYCNKCKDDVKREIAACSKIPETN